MARTQFKEFHMLEWIVADLTKQYAWYEWIPLAFVGLCIVVYIDRLHFLPKREKSRHERKLQSGVTLLSVEEIAYDEGERNYLLRYSDGTAQSVWRYGSFNGF